MARHPVAVVAGMVAAVLAGAISIAAVGTAAAGPPETVTYIWAPYQWQPGTPVTVSRLSGETSVDEGDYTYLATLPDGEVATSTEPLGLPGPTHVVQVVDGGGDFLALSAPSGLSGCPRDTSVWSIHRNTATVVAGLTGVGVVQIAEASNQRFALTCRGKVYGWGNNSNFGALGFPANVKNVATPTVNPGLTRLTGGTSRGVVVTAGESFGSLLVHGQVYAWGNNAKGQCGCNSASSTLYTPTPVVQHGVSYTWVDAGGDQADNGNSVALDAAGHAYCWGDNEEGQCGSSGPNLTEPALVRGLPVIKDARAGAEYSLFLGQNGSVWLAGAFRPDPVEALAAGSATQISAGAGVAAAAG